MQSETYNSKLRCAMKLLLMTIWYQLNDATMRENDWQTIVNRRKTVTRTTTSTVTITEIETERDSVGVIKVYLQSKRKSRFDL